MKKLKAQKERKQQEAIVKPRVEIKDPSAELLSPSRSWERGDPLQDSFLEQPESPQPRRDYHRVPRLKFRNTTGDLSSPPNLKLRESEEEGSEDRGSSNSTHISGSDDSGESEWSAAFDADPEVVPESDPTAPSEEDASSLPQGLSKHTSPIPIRSKSLPPVRDTFTPLSVSLPKIDFQIFSQRCPPTPTSASPLATTPVFELPADSVLSPAVSKADSDIPSELEGSPVETHHLRPAPLQISTKQTVEEPEASPYSRFAAFVKSSHALNASLSTIAETEEEAASRRASAQIYELPDLASLNPSTYSTGASITPRVSRNLTGTIFDRNSGPFRHLSTRSTHSTDSTISAHSMFSFEFSNSDTEKIYISAPGARRESSAPSLTDVSSVDDFDIDVDADSETRRSRSISKRNTKLERFFDIRQCSVGSESESSLTLDASQASSSDTSSDGRSSNNSLIQASKPIRNGTSLDDLDLSLALENDPYRREIILMHRSILAKSQMKQDAKLEKFFGCDKNQIEVARKASTGSRLAGNTDDLKYRSIGW